MILPIYLNPLPQLRRKARKVTDFTPELAELAENMRQTMHGAVGIGLAAPQIGQAIKLIVLELKSDEQDEVIPYTSLVNPRIVWHSKERDIFTEACLSIPGVEADVERPARVRVKAQDLQGQTFELKADGILARVLQHEIDHLDGTLFIDYVHKRALKKRPLVDYPNISS